MATSKPIGPGAGAYVLPPTIGYNQHDTRKNRLPMYSFGARIEPNKHQVTPGPKYKFDYVFRNGVERKPTYSFGLRPEAKDKRVAPGPGAHNVPETTVSKNRAPIYTMRPQLCTKNFQKDNVPGSATYAFSIQPIKPKLPAYGMGISLPKKTECRSPGPMAYGANPMEIIRNKGPVYSFGLRQEPVKNNTNSPGANRYNLMEYKPFDKPPSYSFGVRHHQYAPPMIVDCDN